IIATIGLTTNPKGSFMNVFSRGVRNAFRNGIRASAIIGMLGLSIGLSLAMLLANQAIGQKIESVQKSIGNTISVAPAGIRGFQGGGDPLSASDITKIKQVSHVTSVDQTLSDRLNSDSTNLTSAIEPGSFGNRQFRIERGVDSGGSVMAIPKMTGPAADSDFKPPITALGATNALASIPGTSGGNATLSSGKTFDGTKDAAVALIGKDLASKNSLSVGSTFTAYGTTFTVSGIFDAGNTFANNQVIMPLPTVQRLSDQTGAVTAATVHIDSSVNLESTTSALQSKLGSSADVTNNADATKPTLTSLENIKNVSMFSLIGASGTAAVILLLTMVMIVRERRREIGVLKAIGASNLRVMLQFTVESLTLTVLAAFIGIVIGSLAATPVTKMLANNSSNSSTATSKMANGPITITSESKGLGQQPGSLRSRLESNSVGQGVKNLKANVNGSILLYGLGGALLIAAIGSAAAAGLIAKVRPAEVMRAE
ncbi:MAG TPA: FtsX-like permease family protein, partial [Candidatus Saccharimonadales bacterium]|nr:FtsX-like permease family protein [Candidatus Saccharimonadales bacterium]